MSSLRNHLVYLLVFCLSFGQYSTWSINTEKYEAILTDIGRQFLIGLCVSLDGAELFGVECGNENVELDKTLKCYSANEEPFHPTVRVDPLGTAVGSVMHTYTGKSFYSFMGIRFATADTFQMPKIYEEPWGIDFNGGFDATYIRPKCPQGSLAFPVATGDEDCLFLNVYTPEFDELNPKRTYPVMVFIYGGGYTSGDGSLYVPSRLLEEDVIVVVLQYRLSTLGFLYSASISAPGNMGLMDQVTALRWVNKYIKYFNGDEENVTVFGESAGAASASWMQFTPQNSADYNDGSQLLHRVITQSGSALDIWTLDRNYSSSIILHGQVAGCYEEGDTPDDIVNCMKDLPTDQIVNSALKAAGESISNGGIGFSGVTPVIQDELLNILENEDEIRQYIVLPKDAPDMMADGNFLHVDVLSGSNRDEGTLVAGIIYSAILLPNGLQNDEHFLKHEAIPLLVNSVGINDTTGSVSNSFRLGFLPNAEMGNATQMAGGIIDLSGMLFLKAGPWTMAQKLTEANPENNVFFYSFEFESEDSLFDWIFFTVGEMPFDGGVSHADDLLYLFALPSNPGDREKETIKKMTTLWSNFAYYGDPTPDSNSANWMDLTDKWLPYSFERENFLLMSDDFVQSEDFVLRWNYNMLK